MAGHGRVVWLTTKGRRTGRPRSVAVGFADEPDGSVLVAANDDSTAWARNLLVEPICRVDIGGRLTVASMVTAIAISSARPAPV